MTRMQETEQGMQHPEAVAAMRKLAGGSMSNEELVDFYRMLKSWMPEIGPEAGVNLTSKPNDTTFQGMNIKEIWYMGRKHDVISKGIHPQRANLREVIEERYKGTEYEKLLNSNMHNASGTVKIKGLNYGRMIPNLMGAAGGDASTEEITKMYDNLLSAGQGGYSQEEMQARDAKFDTGFLQLKELYLAQMRRMKEKYGTYPTQMHPEDFLSKVGVDYFDDVSIIQDTEQMMVSGKKYFDYNNPDDAEFKLLSDYYGDVFTYFSSYIIADTNPADLEEFKPTEMGLKDAENNVYAQKLKVSERQLREKNPNMKGFTDKEMAVYVGHLRKRFNAEGKENRLIGRFRKK